MERDEADRISAALRDAESRLSHQIGEVKGMMQAHQGDAYAHTPAFQAALKGWEDWRRGTDRWRYTLMGGVLVLAALFGGGALVEAAIHFHLF